MNTRTTLYPHFLSAWNPAYIAQRQNSNKNSFCVDVEESDTEFLIHADLPGVDKKNITVNIEDNLLTVGAEFSRAVSEKSKQALRCERVNGKLERQFMLPVNVQADGIKATLKNGVLTLSLPKGEDTSKRNIAIA